jgi:hypothetical protein
LDRLAALHPEPRPQDFVTPGDLVQRSFERAGVDRPP